jgi:hypothetical protein
VRQDPLALALAHLVRRAALQRFVAHLDHLEPQRPAEPGLVVVRRVGERTARPADGDDADQGSPSSGSSTSGRSRIVSRADHLE